MIKTNRIAIYARVSTNLQDTDAQIFECRNYAERCGYEVIEVYQDTISGVTCADHRPELSRLLEDAFARKFDVVCVWSVDRLGRSLKHCLDILETLRSHHCDFISIKQQIDTSSPTGQLIFNLFACLANYERTMILERTAAGRARAKARGVRFGRPSKMNSSLAAAVRELRARGMSIRSVARNLGIGIGTTYKALAM